MPRAYELGERALVKLIWEALERGPEGALPLGDDVSAIPLGDGRLAVLKCDMLVGKTHVPPGMTPWQAARKAVVMAVSDFAAKGVQPLALLASVAFRPDTPDADISQLAQGISAAAREYGAYVVGGDTNEAADLTIDCLLFGIADEGGLVRRNGARPGDILAVTGPFGMPAAGLKVLLEGLPVPREVRGPILDSVYVPKARLREGLALANAGVATASIDSSDGLAWSLHELGRASNVGFVVESIPLAPEAATFARANGLDAQALALYGGEEFELVVTAKRELWAEARRAVGSAGGTLIRIGYASEDPHIYLRRGGALRPIEPRGFEHFTYE